MEPHLPGKEEEEPALEQPEPKRDLEIEPTLHFNTDFIAKSSHNLNILYSMPWYSVSELLQTLKAIRKINFSIVEQRQQALERLSNMNDNTPVDNHGRFANHPAGGFVCEGLGDWGRKFQQLKSALSYKERDLRTVAPKTDTSEPQHGSISDAQQAFWNSTTAIMHDLLRGDHVYTRDRFERTFPDSVPDNVHY